jgi:hypothetical protein
VFVRGTSVCCAIETFLERGFRYIVCALRSSNQINLSCTDSLGSELAMIHCDKVEDNGLIHVCANVLLYHRCDLGCSENEELYRCWLQKHVHRSWSKHHVRKSDGLVISPSKPGCIELTLVSFIAFTLHSNTISRLVIRINQES